MPTVGKLPSAVVMFPAGVVMTKPVVPAIAAIADSISESATVPPSGVPFWTNTPAIAEAIAAFVAAEAVEMPLIVKFCGAAVGA